MTILDELDDILDDIATRRLSGKHLPKLPSSVASLCKLRLLLVPSTKLSESLFSVQVVILKFISAGLAYIIDSFLTFINLHSSDNSAATGLLQISDADL